MTNKTNFLKTIALVTAQVFTITTLAQSAPVSGFFQDPVSLPPQKTNQIISIPRELGTFSSYPSVKNDLNKSVFYIEDAHASRSAQDKIFEILSFMKKEGKLDGLLLEGISGNTDTDAVRFFTSDEFNHAFWRRLYQEGLISGAEKFVLLNSFPARGLETEDNYRANLDAYRAVLSQKGNIDEFLSALDSKLNARCARIFSPELLKFFKKWQETKRTESDFSKLFDLILSASAKVLKIDWTDYHSQVEWPNLIRLFRLKNLEKNIHPEAARKELRELARVLSMPWTDEFQTVDVLLGMNSEIGRGNSGSGVSSRTAAEKLIVKLGVNSRIISRYRKLTDCLAFLIFQSEINTGSLSDEILKIEQNLFVALSNDESVKRLLTASLNYELLAKALRLELSRDDVRKFAGKMAGLTPCRFETIPGVNALPHRAMIEELLPEIERFYVRAEKREDDFASKISRVLEDGRQISKSRHVAVIAGGYHSRGIEGLLSKKNITVYAIRPHFEASADETSYQRMLLGKYTSDSHLAPAGLIISRSTAQRLIHEDAERNRALRVDRLLRDFLKANPGAAKDLRTERKTKAASLGENPQRLSRRRFLEFLLAGAAAGTIGCTINAREAIREMAPYTPPADEPPAELPGNSIDLAAMRRLLVQNNFQINVATLDVLIRQREADAAAVDRWAIDATVDGSNGVLTVQGGFRSSGGSGGSLLGQAGVSGIGAPGIDPLSDKFQLAIRVIFELLRYATGEYKNRRLHAFMLTQAALVNLKDEIDRLYLEGAELLIEIKHLAQKKNLISALVERLDSMKTEIEQAVRDGVLVRRDAYEVETAVANYNRQLAETEALMVQKKDRLMGMISRSRRDLGRNIQAEIDLNFALPDWQRGEAERMINRATRDVSSDALSLNFDLPANSNLAAAIMRWKAAKIAEEIEHSMVNRPEITPSNWIYWDVIGETQNLDNLVRNIRPRRDTTEERGGWRRFIELNTVRHAERQRAGILVQRADESVNGVRREAEVRITELFNSIIEKRRVIAELETEIAEVEQFIGNANRRGQNGRRLVLNDADIAREYIRKHELEARILNARRDIRRDYERLQVLGAIQASSLGKGNGSGNSNVDVSGILADFRQGYDTWREAVTGYDAVTVARDLLRQSGSRREISTNAVRNRIRRDMTSRSEEFSKLMAGLRKRVNEKIEEERKSKNGSADPEFYEALKKSVHEDTGVLEQDAQNDLRQRVDRLLSGLDQIIKEAKQLESSDGLDWLFDKAGNYFNSSPIAVKVLIIPFLPLIASVFFTVGSGILIHAALKSRIEIPKIPEFPEWNVQDRISAVMQAIKKKFEERRLPSLKPALIGVSALLVLLAGPFLSSKISNRAPIVPSTQVADIAKPHSGVSADRTSTGFSEPDSMPILPLSVGSRAEAASNPDPPASGPSVMDLLSAPRVSSQPAVVQSTLETLRLNGSANIQIRGDSPRGIAFRSKMQGKIEFLIPESRSFAERGEAVFRIIDEALNSRIRMQKEKIELVENDIARLARSSQGSEIRILLMEKKLHGFRTELFGLEREKEVYETFYAPYPLTITSRAAGNAASGSVVFEGIRHDLLRLSMTVPSNAGTFRDIQAKVNGSDAQVLNSRYSIPDPGNNTVLLTLDVEISIPVRRLTETVDYELNFSNHDREGLELGAQGEVQAAVYVRSGKREAFEVIAPQTAGKVIFSARDGEWVAQNQPVAVIQGRDLFDRHISRLNEFSQRVADFVSRDSGSGRNASLEEISELSLERSNVRPLEAQRDLMTVVAPQNGILVESADRNNQVVSPGEKLGKILTKQVMIGNPDSDHLADQVLVGQNVQVNQEDIVRVQLETGEELLGRVIAVSDARANENLNLGNFKSLQVEVCDPSYILNPNRIVRVIVPKPEDQENLQGRYAVVKVSPGNRFSGRLFTSYFESSRLPLLVEIAMCHDPAELGENLTALILAETNARHRLEAFQYFVNHLEREHFYVQMERFVLEGSADISLAALRHLNEEKNLERLIDMFAAAESRNLHHVVAASYHYILDLIESSSESDNRHPLDILITKSRTSETFRSTAVRMLLSIVSTEGSYSIAGIRILRSSFFTNDELGALYRSLKESQPGLAEQMFAELLRRVYIKKIERYDYGFGAGWVRNGLFGTIYFTEEYSLLLTEDENRNDDRRFLSLSPYAADIAGHIDPVFIFKESERNELRNRYSFADGRPSSSVQLCDLSQLRTLAFVDPVFAVGTPEQQERHIGELARSGRYRDLGQLIISGKVNDQYRRLILRKMLEDGRGRMELARTYRTTNDAAVLGLIEGSRFMEAFLADIFSSSGIDANFGDFKARLKAQLAALRVGRDPAALRIYQDVLLKLSSRISNPALKKLMLQYIMALVPGDFELRSLTGSDLPDRRYSELIPYFQELEMREAARRELGRRSAIRAITLLFENIPLTNQDTVIPGLTGEAVELLIQKLSIQVFAAGNSSPELILRDFLEGRALSEQDSRQFNYLLRHIEKGSQDVLDNVRPHFSSYNFLNLIKDKIFEYFPLLLIAFPLGFFLYVFVIMLKRLWDMRASIESSLSAIAREREMDMKKLDDAGQSQDELLKTFLIKGKGLDKWHARLQKVLRSEQVSTDDFQHMLYIAKEIITDEKNKFSLDDTVRKGHDRKSANLAKRHRYIMTYATVSGKLIREYLHRQRKAGQGELNERRKKTLFHMMNEFNLIANYSNAFRLLLDPLVTLQILAGYGGSKSKSPWFIWRFLNGIYRFGWWFLRVAYAYKFVEWFSKKMFEKYLELLVDKANRFDKHMYSREVIDKTKEYFKKLDIFEWDVRPEDARGAKNEWQIRKFITRFLPFAPPLLYLFVQFFPSIFPYFQSESRDMGTVVNWFNVWPAYIFGVILGISIHSFPLLKSVLDNWMDALFPKTFKIEQKTAAIALGEKEGTEIYEKARKREPIQERMMEIEYRQSIAALEDEVKAASRPRSVDVIVVIVDEKLNDPRKNILAGHLEPWLRKDVAVEFVQNVERGGSGAAWLAGRKKIQEGLSRNGLRNIDGKPLVFSKSFEDLRVVTLLANDFNNGFVPVDSGKAGLPFEASLYNQPISTMTAVLANAYKIAQEMQRKNKPGQMIMSTDNFYVGPVINEGDITLLGSRASIEEVVQNKMDVVFGDLETGFDVRKFVKFLNEKNLIEETKSREKMRDHVDVGNRQVRQMPVFAQSVIITDQSNGKYKRVNRLLDMLYKKVFVDMNGKRKKGPNGFKVDYVMDILIPIILKVQSDEKRLGAYQSLRIDEFVRTDLKLNAVDFYTALFEFFEQVVMNDYDVQISIPHRSILVASPSLISKSDIQGNAASSAQSLGHTQTQGKKAALTESLRREAVVRQSDDLPAVPVPIRDPQRLETAVRVAYSILPSALPAAQAKRLINGLDRIHLGLDFIKFPDSRKKSGAGLVMIDASLAGNKALRQLILQSSPKLIVFSSADEARRSKMEKYIDSLPPPVKSSVNGRTLLIGVNSGFGTFINQILSPAGTKHESAREFVERVTGGDALSISDKILLVSASRKEAGKVSPIKVSRRYFYDTAAFSKEFDDRIDENELSRDFALVDLIESGSLWERSESGLNDLKPLIDQVIRNLVSIQNMTAMVSRAA